MSLYVCDKCNCIENTALSHYWHKNRSLGHEDLCSKCDSSIDKWHDCFPQRQYDGDEIVINRPDIKVKL